MTSFPLVLLHRAGGSAADFSALTRALPPSVLPLALDLPGRGTHRDHPPVTGARAAVAHLTEQLTRSGITGDFTVLGHGLGAYLGLALAAMCEINALPGRCTTLFALDSPAPFRARPLLDDDPLDAPEDRIATVACGHDASVESGVLKADLAVRESFVSTMRRTVTESRVVVCASGVTEALDDPCAGWHLSSTASTETLRLPPGDLGPGTDAPRIRVLADLITRRAPIPAGP